MSYTAGMDTLTSSESLMIAYAKGDAEAFNQLYNVHKGPLFRFILRQGIPSSKADELFQEIWLKIINARNQYKSSARFQTWLYTIARNHLTDVFRKTNKELSTEPFDDHEVATTRMTDDELIDKKRLQQKLLQSVESLPFEQREAFLLKFEAGMNNQDIANITGINEETAKSRVRYAIKQLRTQLGGS